MVKSKSMFYFISRNTAYFGEKNTMYYEMKGVIVFGEKKKKKLPLYPDIYFIQNGVKY